MSEVFLSYKRKYDTIQANCVRSKLAALGVKVFIDHDDIGSSDFIDAIHLELAQARAVLVLWTETSVTSSYVKGEALHGLNRNILVAAIFGKLAPENLPSPFNTFNALNLSNWMEAGASSKHPQWQQLLRSLGEKLGRPGLPQLAVTIEDGSDNAKRAFVAAHPKDPKSTEIFSELETKYREQFSRALEKEEGAIDRRADYARRRLKEIGKEFEVWAKEWREGSARLPPDPRRALSERTKDIQEDIEEYKDRIEKQRGQLAALQEQLNDDSKHRRLAKPRAVGFLSIAALMLVGFVLGPAVFEMFDLNMHVAASLARVGLINASNNEILRLRRDSGQLQADASALATQVAQFRSDRQQLAARIEQTDERARVLADKIEQLEKSRQTLAAQVEQLDRDKRSLSMERAALEGQISDLKNREQKWLARDFELQNREKQVKIDSDRIFGLRTALDQDLMKLKADQAELANAQEKLKQRELALAAREAELTSRLEALRKSEGEIISRGEQLDKRSKELSAAESSVNATSAQLAEDQQALKAEREQLAQEKGTLDAQRKDIEKRDAEVKARQRDIVTANAEAQRTEALVARCDNLTSYQYDLDRPSSSKWVVNHTSINPTQESMEVCSGALKRVRGYQQVERRIALGLGRVYSALGTQLAKDDNEDKADDAFNKAIEYWAYAANLGSGHAHNVLGTYYQGQFAVERGARSKYEPPKTKNLKLAWKHFEQAAELGNPLGLTTTAYYLLYPEWFEKITDPDYSRGRRYLDEARQLSRPYDSPYISFVLGVAMLYGHGYPQDEDAGLRLINEAYCRGDRTAAKFFTDSRGRYRPASCARGAVSSG